MRWSLWHGLAMIPLIGHAIALPATSNFASMLMPRADDDFDNSDLSFIKKLAAVGDSYSAGIGAGDRLGKLTSRPDYACSRYSHGYPNIVNSDGRLGDESKRTFEFKSCSGAVMDDVLDTQIPELSSDQQFILLSAGGNDAELVNILNHCVYQWATFNSYQWLVAKLAETFDEELHPWIKKLDIGSLARTCEKQLEISQGLIEDDAFSNKIDAVLKAAKAKLAPGGMIYYTGYAKFWATDMSATCDKVTWTTWAHVGCLYLTTDHRKKMNDLVELMNDKLAAAVKRAGSSVKFINYDNMVGKFGGRYCESGVDESTVESNQRIDLMFYELNTLDPLGKSPWKRSDRQSLTGTFAGNQAIFAQIAIGLDPKSNFTFEQHLDDESMSSALNNAGILAETDDDGSGEDGIEVPNILPDGYGRAFHPQVVLHKLIAERIIFEMINVNNANNGYEQLPYGFAPLTCEIDRSPTPYLTHKGTTPGKAINSGINLRILGVGDSITRGIGSSDGNGYRKRLKEDLSKNDVFFAGTESDGDMENGNYGAWRGKSIKYIADHIGPSLKHRPNIILLHAGTNDLDDRSQYSSEGNDPDGIASRLGALIDKMVDACPDAVILVAMIIKTCDSHKAPRHDAYTELIPGVVKTRRSKGAHVLAVDFTDFPLNKLTDCIHPTTEGYKTFADYWYDYIHQIPSSWITKPIGNDPDLSNAGSDKNGGISTDIPAPDYGNPIVPKSKTEVQEAFDAAIKGDESACKTRPTWKGAGQIARGVGETGEWKFTENWGKAGQVFDGIGRAGEHVRFHDMDGDGKADYLWLDPESGRMHCWLNKMPEGFVKAGTHEQGIIAVGTAPSEKVYIADANGDGLADYLVVNPNDGSVDVWWNNGPDDNAPNGWNWHRAGQLSAGIPHANLATLRFPDINGDKRADYVIIGKDGSLGHLMNTGTDTGRTVEWVSRHGIATGESYKLKDFSKLINGDGRDDYLVFDSDVGLSGFLNQPSNREGLPQWVKQADKAFAVGIREQLSSIHLADMDGNGKVDYIYVDDKGAVQIWHNRGSADISMAIDGLRFADIDGDGIDDYIWVEPDTGAPHVRLNMGPDSNDQFGWGWKALNDGNPIARGTAPGNKIRFADIDGNGRDDYIVIDPLDGGMRGWLNGGPGDNEYGWNFLPQGRIFQGGIGPGANVRLADVDGDGFDDYIYLHPGGRTTIYRNKWNKESPMDSWVRMESMEAKHGIQRRPEEILFHDINGDGRDDYLWVNPLNGIVRAWINNYPNTPAWVDSGEYAGSIGTAGNNIRFATLQRNGRASLVAVNRKTNAIAAWLNSCDDLGEPQRNNRVLFTSRAGNLKNGKVIWSVHNETTEHHIPDMCNVNVVTSVILTEDKEYPTEFDTFDIHGAKNCKYSGAEDKVGRMTCDKVNGIRCYDYHNWDDRTPCTIHKERTWVTKFVCDW
ncbi:SGNH hydrolase-type esterase domain-containing protein [Dactylonectria estremocensis]|uniref:SGNH hydrolase-type esterase domain-containing protein n=1 Tax=Dactylonectria estremocensis TaxID=1079267 RepID=A0A9P9IAX0_9HYPO|nr:SGNH hydrolase-type esterase domain-containing protein [Dactylonectria estremocensis]